MRSGYYRFVVGAMLCLSVARLFQTGNAQDADAAAAAATATSAAQSNAIMTELSNTATSAVDTVRETGKSVEEGLRAGIRTPLALGTFIGQLLNTLSATVATGSGYVASGVGSLDNYANSWPVLGVLTGGANKFVAGVSSAFSDMSANGRETRQKMFAKFREQLDQSSSGGGASATAETAVVAAESK